MKIFYFLFISLLICSCKNEATKDFILVDTESRVTFYIDDTIDPLIKWAVNDLVEDIEKITGVMPSVVEGAAIDMGEVVNGVYIGEYSDNLIRSVAPVSPEEMEDEWEKFIIKHSGNSLYLVGSDVRGTVYAVFELAERLGISPWKWWADVTLEKREILSLALSQEGLEASPSVQYRGIFLNDEDWGLFPWAAETFEPEVDDIGPRTYEKIFQLLLRLKANTIWPAMHPCTKAFYTVPGNKEMAQKYHIVIGTSHAEPMLRNNVGEWDKASMGAYNYFTNSSVMNAYWQERIDEVKDTSNHFVVTLGTRGVHDGRMEGGATEAEKVEMMNSIISTQREMLTSTLERSIEDIPQVLVPYKEVLDLYNAGLDVPEDVTLMWTDDNYGYIRRLSNLDEQKRKGGSGVYYHVSYWGRPHDYLWLSTTQPGLIWYEMTRAYQNGAKKIWIVNVGDIKPAEYTMEFFLDLAWNINRVDENTIEDHLVSWAAREFGRGHSEDIAEIMDEYYRLAFLRKPEYMGWSRTEPKTPTRLSEFSHVANGNELQRRIDSYIELTEKTNEIKKSLPKEKYDAWYQLIEYPVKGASLMNKKFLYAQLAYFENDTALKKRYAGLSQEAYDSIVELTDFYTNEVSVGKWHHMMSMQPRGLAAYKMPEYHLDSSGSAANIIEDDLNVAPKFIQAADYIAANGTGDFEWRSIKGLGYSNSAVTLFPFSVMTFQEEQPALKYTFQIEHPGSYLIEVRCLPTHSNNYDHALTIQVGSGKAETYLLNTKGRCEEWKENVLRNFQSVKLPVLFETTGEYELTISVNQTGIVVDQLAIYPENIVPFYEFRK